MYRRRKKQVRRQRILKSVIDRQQAVKRKSVQITKIVQDKFKALKKDADNAERYLEASSKPFVVPIIEGIKQSLPNIPKPMIDVKQLVKSEKTAVERPNDKSDGKLNESKDASVQTEGLTLETHLRRLSDPMHKGHYDTTYGVRLDGQGETLTGDSSISFSGDDVMVDDKQYKLTDRLLELLFLKIPDKRKIEKEDVGAYKSIVKMTNAHRQMYSAEKPINATKSTKYINVISQLFPPKKPSSSVAGPEKTIGSGFAVNANALVNRLRLLILSQSAGHTAHGKEIEQIVGLLRSNRIIA